MVGSTGAKKTILIFSTAYLPLIGGAEIAVQEVTKRISEYRWIVYCARIQRGLPTYEVLGLVEVHRIGFGIAVLDKLMLPLFAPLVALRHRNVVMLWGIMASYGGLAARIVASFRPKIPFVLSVQEGDSEEHIRRASRGFFWIVQAIFRRATAIHAISNALAAWATKMGYVGKDTRVIANGVDVAHFAQTTESRAAVRAQLGIPESAWVVVTVSRLVAKNGVGDLIAACGALQDDVHLIIVGTGELEQELRSAAAPYSSRMHFVGTVAYQEIPEYLHASDVFCRPSLSEGLGNVFLEAQAAGIPVIATPVGGIPDIVESDVTGVFCEPQNPVSIARAIVRLRGDASLRTRLITTASLQTQKYEWDQIAKQMSVFFTQIIN
jgi:glycosyltransferase involved in cell wall biosynthesis